MLTSPLIDRIEFLPETPPGGERAHVDFPHLSNSQLVSLSRCGLAYYFSRRLKIKEPLLSTTVKGSAFHEGMGGYFLALRAGESQEQAIKIARSTAIRYIKSTLGYDTATRECSEVVDYGLRWYKGPRDTIRTMTLDVLAAIDYVIAHPFVANMQALSVERGYVIHWADKDVLPLVGYTDIVYAIEDDAAVLDWKTGGKIKGDFALAMDLAQVGYAYGAAQDLGKEIRSLTYGSLTWDAPLDGGEAAAVNFARQPIAFSPERLLRLYMRCAEASRDLRDERFRMGDSDFTCPTCPFRFVCSEQFGALDPVVLDSAAHAIAHMDDEPDTSNAAVDEDENPNGPSKKQRDWIISMLQQADVTVHDACVRAGLKPVTAVADLPKFNATKLIDYLKPIAEEAVSERERVRLNDRQIAQARAALRGLEPAKAAPILARLGLESDKAIVDAAMALNVSRDVAKTYALLQDQGEAA